ncbi:alpha/beta hydrolase [Aureivirga marina]|uniref:alpha/beta hydrolase n=1 Tax=Aureivirga marina TaxID=1182451 RepID=UPI0018C904ED|nr:alpha/beta fold hydrolase [Aureivirga marina]
MKYFYLAIFTLLTIQTFSQSHSFYSKPDTLEINSKVFNSKRKITISKPLNYSKIKDSKQCIIYTDGNDEEITGTILQSVNNLYLYDEIPQSVLIGIIHEDRNKELTEKENLSSFIIDEVLPLIQKELNLEKKAILVGHSFGGYFMTNLFLEQNDKFHSCIAISPAFWPNDNDIQQKLENINSLEGNFYIAIGNRRWDDISIKKYYDAFVNEMKSKNFTNFRFKEQLLKGFSHNSTPTVGIPLGLNFCFDSWEWNYIVEEQNQRINGFPDFWRHYKLKAEALEKLHKTKEAIQVYIQALEKLKLDKELSSKEKKQIKKTIEKQIKTLKKR